MRYGQVSKLTMMGVGADCSDSGELDALQGLVHRHLLIAPQAYKVVDSPA